MAIKITRPKSSPKPFKTLNAAQKHAAKIQGSTPKAPKPPKAPMAPKAPRTRTSHTFHFTRHPSYTYRRYTKN